MMGSVAVVGNADVGRIFARGLAPLHVIIAEEPPKLHASVISLPPASRPSAARPANASATTATVMASTAG